MQLPIDIPRQGTIRPLNGRTIQSMKLALGVFPHAISRAIDLHLLFLPLGFGLLSIDKSTFFLYTKGAEFGNKRENINKQPWVFHDLES